MSRFSIGDVLWLTALVALAVARWLKHQQVRSLADQCRTRGQEYTLISDRLKACNAYLNKLDPNRDDSDQF